MFSAMSKMIFFFTLFGLLTTVISTPTANPGILDGLMGTLGLKNPLNSISLLKEPPPMLKTKTPSPECKNGNGGVLLCCESTFDGRFPLVVKLSKETAYELTPDTINGIYCTKEKAGTCTKTPLCCRVDFPTQLPVVNDLVNLALFCHHAPKA